MLSDDAIANAEQGSRLLAGERESDLRAVSRHRGHSSSFIYDDDNDDGSEDDDSESVISVALGERHVERDVIPETATQGRNLSWTSAYMLMISGMVGSGIFATPGTVAKSCGSVGLSLLVWLAGAGIAACGQVVSLEFGCMLPRSGGDKVYLEFTYRHPRFFVSTMVAVRAVIQGFTASNCIVFSEYLLFGLSTNSEPSQFVKRLVAVGLLVFVTVIHGCFLKTGILIQNALGWFKIGLMCFMILTALVVVVFSGSSSGITGSAAVSSWDSIWEGSNWGWGMVSLAIFKVYSAYAGYDNVKNVLNEVRDPVGMLKIVPPAALASVAVLYLLVNIAYFVIVPLEEVKNSGELIAGLFFDKLFGPRFGRVMLPLLISLSVAGNVMVATFSLSRLNQEVARQGLIPFSHLFSSSRPFNAPLGGFILIFIPTILIIVLPPPGEIYPFILDAETYPTQFFALAIALGLLWLRWHRPDLQRPFKAWLPAVVLRIAICIALAAAPFVPPEGDGKGAFGLWYGTYAVVGIGIHVVATVYWYVWSIAMPRWRGYRLEERAEVLRDGTSITSIVKVKD